MQYWEELIKMYSAINTEDYPSKEPTSGNSNLALKALGIIGTPILFVLLTMSITMFNILCEIAEENGWGQTWSYWLAKTIEHPWLNIMLPIIICTTVLVMAVNARR